jgi:hypothetical protein
MDPHADADIHSKATLSLLAESGHLMGDVQPGLHCPAYVILMGVGMTEHRQHPVALSGANVPLEPLHNPQH